MEALTLWNLYVVKMWLRCNLFRTLFGNWSSKQEVWSIGCVLFKEIKRDNTETLLCEDEARWWPVIIQKRSQKNIKLQTLWLHTWFPEVWEYIYWSHLTWGIVLWQTYQINICTFCWRGFQSQKRPPVLHIGLSLPSF